MSDERESKLKIYSIGIVVVDKARGSDSISVTPSEALSMSNGALKDIKKDYKVSAPDAKGIKRSDQVSGTATLIAKWIPYGQSNRMTAPDVIAGETVLIFKFADVDEYYWTSVFREPKLRRLETVMYAFGNIIKGLVAFDKSTSYWAEVSTHDKHIHVHTSKNDGEPYAYDIKLNTAKGNLVVTDDIGNHFVLDSAASKATVTTNSEIELNTTTVVINASSKTTINTPTTLITGNAEIGGNLKLGGSLSLGGGVQAGGAVHGTNI